MWRAPWSGSWRRPRRSSDGAREAFRSSARAGSGLDQAALAFERTAAELVEERATLAAKVAELTAANRALADARESLLRSEKLATVGRLAAGVAHEVGNPLGAISGYSELARSRLPPGGDPQLGDAIDRIASAAERIDHTVRSLLDFARPATLELGLVSVQAALDAALELARVQPRFRNVEVAARVPADLPRVLGRDRELCQVFLNLLLNAADAMDGRGRIEIDAVEGRASSRSRWSTPAAESPRMTSRASSTRSSPPRRPGRAAAWASPSPIPSSSRSVARSTPGTSPGARCSACA